MPLHPDRLIFARKMAEIFGWTETLHHPENALVRFSNDDGNFMDVWYGKKETVGIYVPSKFIGKWVGKYFRHVSDEQLEKMFDPYFKVHSKIHNMTPLDPHQSFMPYAN